MDMTITVELWPVAADKTAVGPDGRSAAGLWLLSGSGAMVDTTPVNASTGVWDTMENLCAEVAPWDAELGDSPFVIKHGTSWREMDTGMRVSFIAVAEIPSNRVVRDLWPNALPISPKLLDRMRKPHLHAADEPPAVIAQSSVLYHALRHLVGLGDQAPDSLAVDDEVRDAMPELVREALGDLRPALARMYRREPRDANVIPFASRQAAA